MDLPGTWSCFIYEDFHPNAKLDVESAIDYLFRCTLAKDINIDGDGYDLLYIDTENYINSSGERVPQKEIEKKINNFLASYDHFEIINNEIIDLAINEEETDSEVKLKLHYKAWIAKGEYQEYNGIAKLKLRPSPYGGWSIYKIDMPGWPV